MNPAFGLYTHIRANRRRSAALMAGLFALVLLLVFAIDLIVGAYVDDGSLRERIDASLRHTLFATPFAALAVLVWLAIGWQFHQAMIDGLTGAEPVSRRDAPELYNLLENLCISRGMPTPTLRIVDSSALNAFATGMNPRQHAISVTRGLIEALSSDELEAVLAHELTHIRNGDVKVMVVAVVIAGIVSLVAEAVFRMLMQGPRLSLPSEGRKAGRRAGGALAALALGLALIALAWLLSLLLRLALSRSREFLADAGAVELTSNPDAMISALMKISGRAEMPEVPSGIMEMCIENHKAGFADLFATHPPIEARIRALVDHAGGRPPAPRGLI